jgi:hypothetical protein
MVKALTRMRLRKKMMSIRNIVFNLYILQSAKVFCANARDRATNDIHKVSTNDCGPMARPKIDEAVTNCDWRMLA